MPVRKEKYYAILGISPTSDKAVIKRAYRKKAFFYHPDRNKSHNASEMFLKVSDAYSVLTGEAGQSKTDAVMSAEEIMSERMKKAKARYYKAKIREDQKDRLYYKSLVEGAKGDWFKWFGVFCAVFSLLWLIDLLLLPNALKVFTILEYQFDSGYVFLNLGGDSFIFDGDDLRSIYYDNVVTSVNSFLFGDLKYLIISDGHDGFIESVPVFSFMYLFPFVQGLLFLPISVHFFKRPTPVFTFLYMFSKYFVSALLIIILITML